MSQRNGLCWEMMEYEVGWVGGILGSRQEGLDLMWNCCRQPTSCTLDTVCCAKRFPRVASFNSQQSCQVAPQDAAWEVRCGLFFLVGEFWLSKCGSGWAEAVGRIRSLTWSAAEAAAAFPLSMTVCPAAFIKENQRLERRSLLRAGPLRLRSSLWSAASWRAWKAPTCPRQVVQDPP